MITFHTARVRWDGEDEFAYCQKCNVESDSIAKSIYVADDGDGKLKPVQNRDKIISEFERIHKDCE